MLKLTCYFGASKDAKLMLEKPKRRWYLVGDMLNEICNMLYQTNGITEEIMIAIHHNIGHIELLHAKINK